MFSYGAAKRLVAPYKVNNAEEDCVFCELPLGSVQCVNSHIQRFRKFGIIMYKCKLCPFRAASRSGVKVHVGTHTNEKPFACPHCPYRSLQGYVMKQHVILMHTGKFDQIVLLHVDFVCFMKF